LISGVSVQTIFSAARAGPKPKHGGRYAVLIDNSVLSDVKNGLFFCFPFLNRRGAKKR
jgi:hypothetical protein